MNGENIDLQEMEQQRQIEEMKKKIISAILTRESFERLGRVRSINPNLAAQAELYLLQIYQTGKLREKIPDEKMREILKVLSEKRDIKIKRL
jgi:DNA-binding TFAR19-related protein (PDSD5 family)